MIKENSKSENIKSYLELLSLASLSLILVSFVDSYFYYSEFDIEVYKYIDASEVILSFTNPLIDLLYLGVVFAALLGFYILALSQVKKLNAKGKRNGVMRLFLVIPVMLLLNELSKRFPPWEVDERYFDILQLNIIIIGVLLYSLPSAIEKYNPSVKYFLLSNFDKIFIKTFLKYFRFVVIVFIVFSHLHYRNYWKVTNLNQSGEKYKVDLYLTDGREIHTHNDFVFVGSTKNYFFFRNLKSEINTVIPSSSVKEQRLKKVRRSL
jgi:hypothetical protein